MWKKPNLQFLNIREKKLALKLKLNDFTPLNLLDILVLFYKSIWQFHEKVYMDIIFQKCSTLFFWLL